VAFALRWHLQLRRAIDVGLRNVSLDRAHRIGQMTGMTIASLLEPITGKPGSARLDNASDWMQGRTLYGGASALVAFTMAQRAFPDLPPLRAAQVGFVAPIGEEIELSAEIVRQGRNVTQVRSEIRNDSGIALTALWLFANEREPNALRPADPPKDWPGSPQENARAMLGQGPSFIQNNFELRYAQDKDADHGATIRRWARLTEDHDLDAVSKLVLMGDVMPPGAMRIMRRMGPISSINWSFNVLDPDTQSEDGWYLAENASQHADGGYSSERLRMWDGNGRQVIDGLQCVAVFG
jgi:acyl-CoA thioesterase